MPGRIMVVHPYWDFWESSVAWDLRADRLEFLREATAVLERHAEVVSSILVASPSDSSLAVADHSSVDAVVMVTSMAVPSATGMAVLDLLPGVPVVIWAASRTQGLEQDFSHSDITTVGSTVGAPMLASALARQGRFFDVVASTLQEPGGLGTAVSSAIAAGRVRQARLLRIGEPVSGYTTVVPPESGWTGFGPEVIDLSPASFAELAQQIEPDTVRLVLDEIEATMLVTSAVDRVGLERAAAAEVALRSAVRDLNCSGGALNCHVPALRSNPAFGIAPCLALGRLTSDGYPFTCTGDILTAVAMLAVQAFDLPTLYHEVEALDYEQNEAILANTGESDQRLCKDSRPEIVPNVWFEHDAINAPCPRYTIPPGPASLVGFVFAPEPRFVVAEGEFTGRSSPRTGTPHAGFRFSSGPIGQAWARWANAGVLHHSAATNQHVADRIAGLASHLGADFVRV